MSPQRKTTGTSLTPACRPEKPPATAESLLAWYEVEARELPWRTSPAARRAGARPDPYHVWLSEIMLQQTTVAVAREYYMEFLRRWPDVTALAAATEDEVLRAWAGLGYYARARNLLRCARVLVAEHDARFPASPAALRRLAGIGPYTAAAIAAIAFDEPVAVVDGNVERVIARHRALAMPLPRARRLIAETVARLVPDHRPGEFAEAMMDLGATICAPRRARCGACPWRADCRARIAGDVLRFPVKSPPRQKPVRFGIAYLAIRADGAVLLRRRPSEGLLGGMVEVPCSDWRTERPKGSPPLAADWRRLPVGIRHTFTHFHLRLDVYRADLPHRTAAPTGCWWSPAATLSAEALPSLMRKLLRKAL